MELFKAINRWYMRKFLPFENPSHELFYDQAAAEAAKQKEIEETDRQVKELFGLEINDL